MRGHQEMGVESIFDLFDRAEELKILHRFDMIMRARAIGKFASLPRNHRTKLFYNLDNRIISAPDYFQGGTKSILKEHNLPRSTLCLEISERHEVSMKMAEENLARYRGKITARRLMILVQAIPVLNCCKNINLILLK